MSALFFYALYCRYRSFDEDERGSSRRDFDADQGGGHSSGRGRGRGRGRGGGRRGYFTDGRGGETLQEGTTRGGRGSRDRGRGRGRGKQGDWDQGGGATYGERGGRRQFEEFGGAGGARGSDSGSGVWGYQDDDDDFAGPMGRSPPPAAGAAAFSPDQGDGEGLGVEVDDGSGGSRLGPVDRDHFYSVKVTSATSIYLPCPRFYPLTVFVLCNVRISVSVSVVFEGLW